MTVRGAAFRSAASCALIALFVPSAHAALGGNAASVITDRTVLAPDSASSTGATTSTASASSLAAMSMSTNTTSTTSGSAAYTVQSVVDAGGTTINEYLDGSGSVFAVAWTGQFMPNLSQLLGSYFADYTSAVAANQASGTVRSPVAIDNGELVVKSGGHMGAFRGMAYLKNRLPGGFTVNQIR